MASDSNQIQISASSRGIADHYYCFTCDEYVWDCDHLIDDRLADPRVAALEGSKLQSFAYDGQRRILEMEFRVGAPYTTGDEIPLPPPPRALDAILKRLSAKYLVVTGCTTSVCVESTIRDAAFPDYVQKLNHDPPLR